MNLRLARPLAPMRYDRIAISLHWLIAVGVVAQIALGWWMIDIPKLPAGVRAYWFNLHKSIGMTLAVLIVARVVLAPDSSTAPLPSTMPRWQVRAARCQPHAAVRLHDRMPLAGYLGSIFSGYPIKYFGTACPAGAEGRRPEGLLQRGALRRRAGCSSR